MSNNSKFSKEFESIKAYFGADKNKLFDIILWTKLFPENAWQDDWIDGEGGRLKIIDKENVEISYDKNESKFSSDIFLGAKPSSIANESSWIIRWHRYLFLFGCDNRIRCFLRENKWLRFHPFAIHQKHLQKAINNFQKEIYPSSEENMISVSIFHPKMKKLFLSNPNK